MQTCIFDIFDVYISFVDRYESLLDRVASRAELNDVLSECIKELSTSHIYADGGTSVIALDAYSCTSRNLFFIVIIIIIIVTIIITA